LPQWQLPLYSISIFLSLAGAKARWPGYPFRRPNRPLELSMFAQFRTENRDALFLQLL